MAAMTLLLLRGQPLQRWEGRATGGLRQSCLPLAAGQVLRGQSPLQLEEGAHQPPRPRRRSHRVRRQSV